MEKLKLLVVAGPNGSGKTSVTGKILKHEWIEGCEYINPDNIARDRYGDWNSPDAVIKAARHAADMREKCIDNGHSLIFENDNSVDNIFPQLLFRTSNGKLTKQYAPLHDWSDIIFQAINDN